MDNEEFLLFMGDIDAIVERSDEENRELASSYFTMAAENKKKFDLEKDAPEKE